MIADDKKAVLKMLTTAKNAFPHCQATSETLMLYVSMLEDLTVVEIKAALYKLMKTAKFFPTIAEIREAADSVKTQANGTAKPTAEQAWFEAKENVRKHGCYQRWDFSCKEVERACRYFGIEDLIMLSAGEENVARAQFFKIYNSILARQKEQEENNQVLLCMGAAANELVTSVVKQLEKAS